LRDGSELGDFWDRWVVAEQRHFAEDPSRPFADLLVRQWQKGYAITKGPAETIGPDRDITHGDGPAAMC
jgi:hypothetical protein